MKGYANGQGELFREHQPPPPPPPLSSWWGKDKNYPPRKPIPLRGGTRLDHRFCVEVWGLGPKRKVLKQLGHIDTSQYVYQTGGEYIDFYYRKDRLISMQPDVWEQIIRGPYQRYVRQIEMIDHLEEWVYVIPRLVAEANIRAYEESLGPRVGVRKKFWTRFPFPRANWTFPPASIP